MGNALLPFGLALGLTSDMLLGKGVWGPMDVVASSMVVIIYWQMSKEALHLDMCVAAVLSLYTCAAFHTSLFHGYDFQKMEWENVISTGLGMIFVGLHSSVISVPLVLAVCAGIFHGADYSLLLLAVAFILVQAILESILSKAHFMQISNQACWNMGRMAFAQ